MEAKRYFRKPIPEIYDVARYLDAAVSAHLSGHVKVAEELFVLANNKELWDWVGSNSLINEAKRIASMRFTEMPNGANETAFNYPEEQRQQAYMAYEEKFLANCAKEENMLRFKAYVARRLGLRVPFK